MKTTRFQTIDQLRSEAAFVAELAQRAERSDPFVYARTYSHIMSGIEDAEAIRAQALDRLSHLK